MGRIMVGVRVVNHDRPELMIECTALVDTGAYMLTLPSAWRERLGPLATLRTERFELADGRLLDGEISGPVRIEIEGFGGGFSGEVLFLDMSEAGKLAEPLLGYLTLEAAGVMVDMVGHRLAKVRYFDLKGAAHRDGSSQASPPS